jgi:hypothetical protein
MLGPKKISLKHIFNVQLHYGFVPEPRSNSRNGTAGARVFCISCTYSSLRKLGNKTILGPGSRDLLHGKASLQRTRLAAIHTRHHNNGPHPPVAIRHSILVQTSKLAPRSLKECAALLLQLKTLISIFFILEPKAPVGLAHPGCWICNISSDIQQNPASKFVVRLGDNPS